MEKDKKFSRLELRLPTDVKDAFADWCQEHGTTPTNELRKYVMKTIKKPPKFIEVEIDPTEFEEDEPKNNNSTTRYYRLIPVEIEKE